MLHYKFEPFCQDGLHSTHCTMNDERSLYLNVVSLCHANHGSKNVQLYNVACSHIIAHNEPIKLTSIMHKHHYSALGSSRN